MLNVSERRYVLLVRLHELGEKPEEIPKDLPESVELGVLNVSRAAIGNNDNGMRVVLCHGPAHADFLLELLNLAIKCEGHSFDYVIFEPAIRITEVKIIATARTLHSRVAQHFTEDCRPTIYVYRERDQVWVTAADLPKSSAACPLLTTRVPRRRRG